MADTLWVPQLGDTFQVQDCPTSTSGAVDNGMITVDKIKTIDRILIAAEQGMALKGIDGVKIENIARAAGVTKQLIYHYFKSKDQLYNTVLEASSKRTPLLSDIDIYKKLTPEKAIRHIVNAIFNGYIENPSYATLTLDQALHDGEHISDGSSFIPTMRIFIAEVLEPILRRGGEGGVLKPGLDANVIFWMIFNLIASGFLNRKIISETSNIDLSDSRDFEMWREAMAGLIVDALRA